MGALKRFAILVSLMLVLVCSSIGGAELGLGLTPESYAATGEVITLTISLQALSVTESRYVRSSWLDEVSVSAFDESGGPIPMRVVTRRRGPESIVSSELPRNDVVEDGIVLRAEIEVEGLPEGRAIVRVAYQNLKNEISFKVANDSAKEKVLSLRRGRTDGKKLTYAEYRADALRRMDATPGDYTILWKLAEESIRFAPVEETTDYFRRAIESEAAFIERMRTSEIQLDRASVPGIEREFRRHNAMANAIVSLLPEYHTNRETQNLVVDWMGKEVLLQDRKSMKTIKAVRAFTTDTIELGDTKPK